MTHTEKDKKMEVETCRKKTHTRIIEQEKHHLIQSGAPDPVGSRVSYNSSYRGEITPVSHVFSAVYRGEITSFITIVGARLVGLGKL